MKKLCNFRFKFLNFIIFFSVMFISIHSMAASYDPTNDLTVAFGSSCQGAGDISRLALTQSSNLKNIISSVRGDESCQGIPTPPEIDLAIQTGVDDAWIAEENIRKTKDDILDLSAAIETEKMKPTDRQDLVFLTSLKTSLSQRQADLVKTRSDFKSVKRQRGYDYAKNYFAQAGAFLDGLAANATCVNAHPNILTQVGSHILKASSGLAFGMTGSTILAAGGLIDRFVRFFRNYNIGKDLKDLIDNNLGQAIGCAFEGLSSTYCRSRDLQLILDANKDFHNKIDSCSSYGNIGRGVNVMATDLPAFNDMVSAMYAGSKASSESAANEKKSVLDLKASIDKAKHTFDGVISKFEKNYDQAQTDFDKQSVRKLMVDELSAHVKGLISMIFFDGTSSKMTTGPLVQSFIYDSSCGPLAYFYSLGKKRECRPNMSLGEDCVACVVRENQGVIPSVSEIKTLSVALLGEGNQYVDSQLRIYLQNNPQLAITQTETYGKFMKKGRQFLDDAKIYLKHLLKNPNSIAKGQMKKTIENCLVRIEKVIKLLNTTKIEAGDESAANLVTLIKNELAPSSDTLYVPNELSVILKHDIDTQVMSGKIDPSLAVVLQLSTSDSLSELLNVFISPEALRSQIRSSRLTTKQNLQTIGKVFATPLISSMRQLKSRIPQNSKSTSDEAEQLSLLCVQALLVPSAPVFDDTNIGEFCSGRMYWSVYEKKGLRLEYDKLVKKPFEERVCSVYDFYRRSRLNSIGVK